MKIGLGVMFAALLVLCGAAYAEDPRITIAEFEWRLTRLGPAKIEGTEKLGSKAVPAIYFGQHKMNGNSDVVDDEKQRSGATATVFVKDGDEFVRVATNVLTADGKRGVGTYLVHARAYEAVIRGETFCGDVDVLGTPFYACYDGLKDAKGYVIGALYVGYRK